MGRGFLRGALYHTPLFVFIGGTYLRRPRSVSVVINPSVSTLASRTDDEPIVIRTLFSEPDCLGRYVRPVTET